MTLKKKQHGRGLKLINFHHAFFDFQILISLGRFKKKLVKLNDKIKIYVYIKYYKDILYLNSDLLVQYIHTYSF